MTRILVIEDEDGIRNNLLRMLRIEGFDVTGAENGRIGLGLIPEFRPDLIISDVTMPEMDGHGVLKELRANPATASIPFIFLTAMADTQGFRLGLKLGADDYLTKPFTRDDVLESIHSRLARQQAVAGALQQELELARSELRRHAHIDAVTGLPDRFALAEAFTGLSSSGDPLTVLCVGLDRFVEVGAGMSASGMDTLLKQLAERLCEKMGGQGHACRLMGETFLLVLPGREGKALDDLLEDLRHHIRQPFDIEGQQIVLTASMGTAQYPAHADSLDKLVGKAQAEMSRSRARGGDTWSHFDPASSFSPQTRLEMEIALHGAVAAGELRLLYQPQVCLKRGAIVGAEALVRWQDAKHGMVSPAIFIPIAEESGAILNIGAWVLHTACVQAKAWMDAGLDLKVGVNVSARQLRQQNLVGLVQQVLAETGLPAERLDLEITESALVHDAARVADMLTQLKALGVSISIDDFGTGYSSLAYLQKLPFDKLKIDRSFVSGLPDADENAGIVRALLLMAEHLEMETIAEGVETPEELAFLREAGCGQMQGYLFSKPLSNDDFTALLDSGKSLQRI
jgi:diguanylate cyclase (GGDEF)-like protein